MSTLDASRHAEAEALHARYPAYTVEWHRDPDIPSDPGEFVAWKVFREPFYAPTADAMAARIEAHMALRGMRM